MIFNSEEINNLQQLHSCFMRHFQNGLSFGFCQNAQYDTYEFHLYYENRIISAVELNRVAILDGSLSTDEVLEKVGQYMAHQVINILLTKRGHAPIPLEEEVKKIGMDKV